VFVVAQGAGPELPFGLKHDKPLLGIAFIGPAGNDIEPKEI
jgi:hypothetical protein